MKSGLLKLYGPPLLALVGIIFVARAVILTNVPQAPPPPSIKPAESPYKEFIAGAGIVEARSENIAVAPYFSGIISEVAVKVGDNVKKDDLLFALDNRAQIAIVEEQKASVGAAEANLANARARWQFISNVQDKRALSQEEFIQRKSDLLAAEAGLQKAQAALKHAETNLQLSQVRAPISGVVLQSRARVGEFATAQAGQNPLMIIGDTSVYHLRVEVDENDAWKIIGGAKAIAFVRGNPEISVPLEFVRIEKLVIPKRNLTGDTGERVDVRVLQVIFSFDPHALPIYIGQLMDVFIENKQNLSDNK
ncbi:MAG TPA: efflux RND transporter periplasmic adaptor subunit [Oligoflexia bacterium]|nr:efflux RND transporter periplasmic adaptor subunit [Oligoflexia bacterium]HMP27220.1 efflux RND transporter periplasmic adaptor subunit [Oligoflexia bacterium]